MVSTVTRPSCFKGDFKATWYAVVDKLWRSRQFMLVIKATSTRTSKNNIQWRKILPSSDKEITPLKSSWSLGYNLGKRIVLQRRTVLVTLTAVDLRQTIMYAAWPDNICFKSSSLSPRKAFRMALSPWLICFLLSAFFLNTSFSEFCHSWSKFVRPSITWQKKSLQCFVQRISRAYPGNFIVILNNFRLPRQEEIINKNKQNKTQQQINIYIFAFVSQKGKTERKMSWPFFY